MKRAALLSRIFNSLFLVCWVGMFVLMLARHDNPYLPLGIPQLLVCFAGASAALFAIRFWWDRFGRALRRQGLVVAVLLGVYFAFLLWFGMLMRITYQFAWDYPEIAKAAQDYVLKGEPISRYFAFYPNNTALFWLHAGFFAIAHFFGATDIMSSLVVLNAFAITFSVYMVYRTALLLWGEKWALLMLPGAMTCPAFVLYAPIAYTDTLTMPFAMSAAFLWLKARRCPQRPNAALPWAVAAFAVAALGAVLKVTVAILVVAFVLDVLFLWQGRERWPMLAAAVVCFAVLCVGGSRLAKAPVPDYEFDPIPYTHWIMMGLRGRGYYNDDDYKATLEYDTYEERVNYNIQEIQRRLQAMGPAGFVDHSLAKLAFIISDGTYFAPTKLARTPLQDNALQDFIFPGRPYTGFLLYSADAWQLCLFALCAVGALRALREPETGVSVLRLAVFGLVLFLLIWEARSRYLVNFLPLMLLCGASGLAPRQTQ